jgi:hypothetical protein
MNPIKFKEQNCIIAKEQPQYLQLPAYKSDDGIVTTCWKLSFSERIKILISGNIWIELMTFNHPIQPQRLSINNPIELINRR